MKAVKATISVKSGIIHDGDSPNKTIPAIMPRAAGRAGTYERGAFKKKSAYAIVFRTTVRLVMLIIIHRAIASRRGFTPT